MQVANPEAMTILIDGDGSFGMTNMDLQTVKRPHLFGFWTGSRLAGLLFWIIVDFVAATCTSQQAMVHVSSSERESEGLFHLAIFLLQVQLAHKNGSDER